MDLSEALIQDLKRKRQELNWTYERLSKESEVGTTTIWNIESGKVSSVKDETLQRIEAALQRGLSGQSGTEERLRIGFGHTLWSAPFILALHKRGGLNGCDAYSYGVWEEDESSSRLAPNWLSDDGRIATAKVPSYGIFDRLNKRSVIIQDQESELQDDYLSGVVQEQDGKRQTYQAFTASQLLEHLERKEIDGAIIPNIVLENLMRVRHRFEQVATLVFSFSGSTVLSIYNKERIEFDGMTEGLKGLLKVCQESGKNVPRPLLVLYPEGTICEEHFNRHIKDVLDSQTPVEVGPVVVKLIDIANPDETAQIIIEYIERGYVVWQLGWHPNNDWIESKVFEQQHKYLPQRKVDLLRLLNAVENNLTRFTFSLILRENVLTAPKRQILKTVLDTLFRCVKDISEENNDIRMLQKSGVPYTNQSNRNIVPSLARYLDMEIGKCAQALADIHFFLSIYPEFYLQSDKFQLEKS